MTAFKAILWFAGLITSIALIFHVVGWRGMVSMFPEGWRWWQLPLQLATLALFAALVLNHPFR